MAEIEKKTQFLRGLVDLRSMIFDGVLAPGERLSEVPLARTIGISRTPLREVMSRLVEDGLLERLPSGGYQVLRFSVEDAADAIEIRGVIEGTALRLAAERGAAPDVLSAADTILDRIDEALAPGPDALDFDAYIELNSAFHSLFGTLAASGPLQREIDRMARLPLAGPSNFLDGQGDQVALREALPGAQAQHRAMLDAVRRREGTRAEALAREHARLARINLDDFVAGDRVGAARVQGMTLVAGP